MSPNFDNPFKAPEKTTLEKMCSLSRAKAIAGLLMVASPSIEACSMGAQIGRGPLSAIHEGERPEDPELPDYAIMLDKLKSAVGEDALSAEFAMHQAYADNYKESTGMALENLDKLDIDEKAFRDLLDIYPRSWSSNLKSISINPHFVPMPYPGLEGEAEFAHCERTWKGDPIKIEFTSDSLRSASRNTRLFVLETLSHELAHAADPGSNVRLSAKQSLSLKYMTLVAVSDPGRPKFSYPESIKAKTDKDKQAETQAKMTEYFAEIMDFAISHANGDTWETWRLNLIKRLESEKHATPQAAEWNVKLIKDYFQWSDPDYKVWEAGRNFWKQVDNIENIRSHRGLERGYKLIPEDLVTQLNEIINDTTTRPEEIEHQYSRIEELLWQDVRAIENNKDAKKIRMIDAIKKFNSLIEQAMTIRNIRLNIPGGRSHIVSGEEVESRVESFYREYGQLDEASKQASKQEMLKRLAIAKEKAPPS
jgi:hypothetical protein